MGIPQGILRKRKVAVRIVGVAGLTLQGIRYRLQAADPVIAVGRHISQSIGLCCQLADGIIGIFQGISLRCRHREDSALSVIGVCRSTAAGIGHSQSVSPVHHRNRRWYFPVPSVTAVKLPQAS